MRGLIIDGFAGGGGASLGIEMALGRSPDIAINHDAEAIALHKANHPTSRHYQEDVWEVDPTEACAGSPVSFAWFSPDCKDFSKAKGGQPISKRVRGLAWVVVRWAKEVRPLVIGMENVEEFEGWGPIDRRTGRRFPERKGETFQAFVRKLRRLGYVVEWRVLRACDYGAPTSRKRLFLIARCDGNAIVWPKPTHGKGTGKPWRTAAECIDWSIPCPSIFLTREEGRAIGVKRPLVDATMRRIARGVWRYVINAAEPFIVGLGGRMGQSPERSVSRPYQTITAKADAALVVPTLIQAGYGERQGQAPRVPGLEKPLGTVVAGGKKHALVAAFLAKHYGGHETPGASLELPLSTATTQDHHAIVATYLQRDFGESIGSSMEAPAPTITAGGNGHLAEVRAFLIAYYGQDQALGSSLFDPVRTISSRDKFGLVTVQGTLYQIVDIGMRMLAPRELYRAQGFPDSYLIDIPFRGRLLTKTAQVRMCGNSVPPDIACALAAANAPAEAIEVAA